MKLAIAAIGAKPSANADRLERGVFVLIVEMHDLDGIRIAARGMGRGRGGGGGRGRGMGQRGGGGGMGRGGGRGTWFGRTNGSAANSPNTPPPLADEAGKQASLEELRERAGALHRQAEQVHRQLEAVRPARRAVARVREKRCTGCGVCVEICPVDAISIQADKARIDENECIGCGACVAECPVQAIEFV